MKTWITQLRKGVLEFCVLNILSHEETYGYEIMQRLKELAEMAITESTVYPILSRLKAEGYLKVRAAASLDGPPRRYFSLTESGRIRLKQMNEYWDALNGCIGVLKSGEQIHEVSNRN